MERPRNAAQRRWAWVLRAARLAKYAALAGLVVLVYLLARGH